MSVNGTRPTPSVVACRQCGRHRELPPRRRGRWEFDCTGCGARLEIHLDGDEGTT